MLTLDKFGFKFKSFVINLERRRDRLDAFKKNAKDVQFLDIETFNAIDGEKLESTDQLCRIFDGNDFQMRSGMVGVTLSHMLLYLQLMNREDYKDTDAYLIFEDDIIFANDFDKKLHYLHLQMIETDWDIVYLGHHYFYQPQEMYDHKKMPEMEKWSKETSLSRSMGGIGGYFISKKGACKLMEFINEKGMTNGIDTMQQKAANDLNVYYVLPHLFFSECYRGYKMIDSDIQYNFNSLCMPLERRLMNEIEFFEGKGISLKKINEYDEVVKAISNENYSEPFYYELKNNEGIEYINKNVVHPYYYLEDKIIIVVPGKISGRYFERLKKHGNFNIDDAIKYKI